MIENHAANEVIDEEQDGEPKGARQRSTIGFPYTDYEGAAQVAAAIYGNCGHGTCTLAQLAAWMNSSMKSSSFRTLISAARLFGLVESDNAESYRLTDLGTKIADPSQARAAQAEAFLRVPLFAALFEKYKTSMIPPNAALEREIAALGVSEKQKTRARQVFESSAQQTGFRAHGTNRLVMPAVVVPPSGAIGSGTGASGGSASNGSGGGTGGSGGGSDVNLDLDPLLIALLQKIPPQGQPWPKERRVRWFKTFAMNVSEVYDSEGDPVEMTIS
ncbi:hypothetical protein [Pseudorhodoferax sp.]|uniref:hypothetical protein n=1 Tax=Pseudorhodoferax sp. TaxID=1993553 RepID=UPI0039E2C1B4